jgi:isoleucyl-tRNA synthetase
MFGLTQVQCPMHNGITLWDKIDENKDFPADFIAEGVDQTRGCGFILACYSHFSLIVTTYKNVVSNVSFR